MTGDTEMRVMPAAIWLATLAAAASAGACSGERSRDETEQPNPSSHATTVSPKATKEPSHHSTPDASSAADAVVAETDRQGRFDSGSPPLPSTRSSGERVDDETIASVRAQIVDARRWSTIVSSPTNEFVSAIVPRFDEWSRALIALSASGRQAEADSICSDIVDLRGRWGPQILPIERFDAFVRDRFWVGSLRIEAAQFFEPVRLYPGDGRIEDLYRFSVYDEDRVVERYFVERIEIAGDARYSLGKVDVERGEHRDVSDLGDQEPRYWAARDLVLHDVEEAFAALRRERSAASNDPNDAASPERLLTRPLRPPR
jgi:hypothetical protein